MLHCSKIGQPNRGQVPEPVERSQRKIIRETQHAIPRGARKGNARVLSSGKMFALGSIRSLLPSLLVPLSVIVALASGPAQSQGAGDDRKIAFDIPAQPLDGALTQYFQATGVQLLYDSSLTRGRRSTTVRGRYARREALRLLLTGTGLIVRYSRANAAIITTPTARTSEGPLIPLGRVVIRERFVSARLSPAERMIYYNQLEDELQTHLRGDRRTERLAFSIVVEFHVDEVGKLNNVRINKGSGDRKIDLTIRDTLGGAVVSPPPDLLDQPLSVALKGIRH